MKTNTNIIILALGIILLSTAGCKKDRTTGEINVTVTVLPGETVNLTGIKVQLHGLATFDDLLKSAEATGTSGNVSARFELLVPGKYYVCAWNDRDADQLYSAGDYFGFYTYPVELLAKDTKEIHIEVYILD